MISKQVNTVLLSSLINEQVKWAIGNLAVLRVEFHIPVVELAFKLHWRFFSLILAFKIRDTSYKQVSPAKKERNEIFWSVRLLNGIKKKKKEEMKATYLLLSDRLWLWNNSKVLLNKTMKRGFQHGQQHQLPTKKKKKKKWKMDRPIQCDNKKIFFPYMKRMRTLPKKIKAWNRMRMRFTNS